MFFVFIVHDRKSVTVIQKMLWCNFKNEKYEHNYDNANFINIVSQ